MRTSWVRLLSIMCFSSFLLLSFQANASDKFEYLSTSDKDCAHGIEQAKSGSIKLDCKTYHQTTNYTCGPAAVMTLLHYYGRLSAAEMNQKTELRMALEMGASSEGTTMGEVASWLGNHGFNVDSGMNVDSDLIINNLKKGIPTLVGVNQHWILAKGFEKGDTDDTDQISFSDSCCGVKVVSRANLDSMWAEAHMPGSHCGENIGQYIVATPK